MANSDSAAQKAPTFPWSKRTPWGLGPPRCITTAAPIAFLLSMSLGMVLGGLVSWQAPLWAGRA